MTVQMWIVVASAMSLCWMIMTQVSFDMRMDPTERHRYHPDPSGTTSVILLCSLYHCAKDYKEIGDTAKSLDSLET